MGKKISKVQNDRTPEELIELAIEWFDVIVERASRLTSGNVAHDSKNIMALAGSFAEVLRRELKKKEVKDK